MGHALDDTIQDVLIRFKRMQGFDTLWLPGSDHAAISTEMKVVQKIGKEGKALVVYDRHVYRCGNDCNGGEKYQRQLLNMHSLCECPH